MSGFRPNLTTSTKSEKPKRKKEPRVKRIKMELVQTEKLRKVEQEPKYEKVTSNRISLDWQWVQELIRGELAKKMKKQIPANAKLIVFGEGHAALQWESKVVACRPPKEED